MKTALRANVIQEAVKKKSGKYLDIVVHDVIDSTNSWSLQQCKQGKALPFVCFAEQQTSGRGRRGKSWQMVPQTNIAMSLCWSFRSSRHHLHLLALSISLAIIKTLEQLGLGGVQIKWPNDIYVNDRKIAGILIETLPRTVTKQPVIQSQGLVAKDNDDENDSAVAVIGVGLNIDMSAMHGVVTDDVTGLSVEVTDIQREAKSQGLTKHIDREQLAILLLQNLIDFCCRYRDNDKSNLELYRKHYDYCKNKIVNIQLENQQILTGVATGINDAAELLVLIDGDERVFNSADVSVRAHKS